MKSEKDITQTDVTYLDAPDVEQIYRRLREEFDEDRIQLYSGRSFRVAGESSRVVAFPQNIEELSEMVRYSAAQGWRMIPAGAGTWLEMGNPPRRFHLVVSTSRMNRVIEYEPADLTATVEAGCSLADFNRQAAASRQMISLDPFGAEESSIGAMVATAGSGPLRCAYGTPRDWVIGMRVVQADGRITSAGGKVVKNVAGYDLCKLYAGSYGTLAILAEMSFKLRALPSAEKTVVFFADQPRSLCSMTERIFDSDLQPAACEMIAPGDDSLPLDPRKFALALRFLDEPETLDSQVNEALRLGTPAQSSILGEKDAHLFWSAYRESEIHDRWDYSLRLAGLPADLNHLLEDASELLPPAHWRAHAANGIVRIFAGSDWLEVFKNRERAGKITELRRRARSRGGQLILLRAPESIGERIDSWGDPGPTGRLMISIKEKLDPRGLLNPGRFVAGI